MTNSLAHQSDVTSYWPSISGGLRRPGVTGGDLSVDTETKRNNEVLLLTSSGLSEFGTSSTQPVTLELASDKISDEGTYPATALISTSIVSTSIESDSGEDFGPCKKFLLYQNAVDDTKKCSRVVDVNVDSTNGAALTWFLSASNVTPCASHENRDASDSEAGPELSSSCNRALVYASGIQPSTRITCVPVDENTEGVACSNVSESHCQPNSSSVVLQHGSRILGGNVGLVSLAESPIAPLKPDVPATCEIGDLVSTIQVAPQRVQVMPESSGASSSHASIMHSDDENVKECRKGSCEVVFRDLEAGLPIDVTSSVDEEGMHGVDLVEDRKCSSLVESTKEAVPVKAYDDDAPSCDMKDLVDSELREPLLAPVQTDNTKSSQDKEELLGGETKLGGDSLEKEAEVHGLRKRRGAKADGIKPSAGGDSGFGKMPDEHKKGVTTTRSKDASTDVSQEAKQKPVDKKTAKQGKSAGKPAAVKKVADPQPLEESRAKDEAEANRKVHESLDNFIRQTIRCEPYMNFTNRPGDKPLQRLRPDVFENHVAGKFARGLKVDSGSDPRDIATEENRGVDINPNDVDGSTGSAKGISGLRTGAQHSLKVPPGVVAFTQSTSKGSDLQGWLSPSKTKCEKCAREFCSSLNYRRHVRVHRRSLNPEKEDLSKERSKVAAFWDKLTPEKAGSILHTDNMEIEDLSGQAALDALRAFIHQPGLPSFPQGILKAGSLLLDIVRGYVPLSSERLLAILDDASEKTFLCGGTSIAAQRFIFNGEAGKVGLEERNLVATMGFHIELNLVKAWMADKEAEALRCQQALFKEEEAAQEKREKLLEKKRMKKIRQKEKKGTTSQLIMQELENESNYDDGNVQGICEDDSPTGTGSSSSSLVSAQDLALPESAELDEADALTHNDIMDEHELVLGDKSDTGKTISSDDDQLHRSRDGLSQYGRERLEVGGHRGDFESLYREEDNTARDSFIEIGAISQSRPADQVDWDGDIDSRSSHPYPQSRSARTGDSQVNPYYRKGEQDRIGPDFKRREFERSVQERRPLRITRDRSRNDYSEPKPLRDSRGFEGRYGDINPTSFKPLRKPHGSYSGKIDSGTTDLSNVSRLQQYRSKPSGMNRASSNAGNGQVVWTRKVPQAAGAEVIEDRQDETVRDDAESSKGDGWAGSEALPKVVLSVPDVAGGDVATKIDKGSMEKNDDAATPVPLDLSEAGSRTVVGSCCDGSSGLMKTTLPSVRLQDSGLTRSGDDLISAEEMPEVDDGLSGALLVGSLSVPLGKFATVRTSHTRSGSSAPYLHRPDDSEAGNVIADGSHDESYGLSVVVHSSQEARFPSNFHTATGSSDYSEILGKSLGSSLGASGSRSNSITIQSTNLKSQFYSTSPERGESSRHIAPPLGHERLSVKQGSWQTSAGRYIHAKVWRAVGVVGERPELNATSGDSACSFLEARLSQDVDSSGRSDGERETSPTADVWQVSPSRDDEIVRRDSEERHDLEDDHLKSKSQVMLEGTADCKSKAQSDNGIENASLSVYVDAGTFLNERWRAALALATDGEVLLIPSDNILNEPVGFNFLDMVSRQLFTESSRQTPAAESGPPPSSAGVTELSDKGAQDDGGNLSKVFSDSDHTYVEDIIYPSTVDEQALDEASSHAHSSEDDTRLRDASTSPLRSEHNMSGSETASPVLGENISASGDGGVVSSYARRGDSRQERWHRNSRDRYPEQRYMARRRAPAEKNSSATRL